MTDSFSNSGFIFTSQILADFADDKGQYRVPVWRMTNVDGGDVGALGGISPRGGSLSHVMMVWLITYHLCHAPSDLPTIQTNSNLYFCSELG